MRRAAAPARPSAAPLSRPRRWVQTSYSRLAMTDGLFGFGVVTAVIGVAGLADDVGDALILLGSGLGGVAIGIGGQRTFVRARRPPPG